MITEKTLYDVFLESEFRPRLSGAKEWIKANRINECQKIS